MMNFIIYEDDKKWQQQYKNTILKIVGKSNINYTILTMDNYLSLQKNQIFHKSGKKIYILDLEVPGKNGLDFAHEIRKNGDWKSPIIVITSHEKFKNKGYTSKILMLNFIIKNKNCMKELENTLNLALDITKSYPSFNFTYDKKYYQIPYEDILYFEKNINDNYTSIITKNDTYLIKESIKKLKMQLEAIPFFFQTHQSCIINLKNIKKIDFHTNQIYFLNKKISLLSRNKKKELKVLLAKEYNYDHTKSVF